MLHSAPELIATHNDRKKAMRINTQKRQEPSANPASRLPQGTALQRKCACGGSTTIDAECKECKGKQLAMQRYSAGREAPDTLVNRLAIGSSLAFPDSSDSPSPLGHN